MATRFYLPATGAAAVSPTISAADWAHINALRLPLNSVKGASTIATTTYAPDVADHLVAGRAHVAQFVSDVLPAQIIPAQTVRIQVRVAEAVATNNLFLNWKIYAVSVDGSTVLGTLLAVKADATEVGTALTNRMDSATTTLFTASDNFRLVLEIGLGGTPTASAGVDGHNGSMSFGESAATDMPEDDASTAALNPWLQFAQNLKFGIAGGAVTYTHISTCPGGDHVTMDVKVNSGATQRITYDIDEVRKPLSDLTEDQADRLKELLFRVHIANRTRPQLVTEFANPVVIPI